MNRCGVFLLLFFALFFSQHGYAWQIEGNLQGSLGVEGIEHELGLCLLHNWRGILAELGLSAGISSKSSTLQPVWDWKFEAGSPKKTLFTVIHNRPHYSSTDLFRLIHKDNFCSQSDAVLISNPGFQLGFLRRVPLKTLDFVDAFFYQGCFQLGNWKMQGTKLLFSGYREAGQAEVIQLEGSAQGCQSKAGLGWQTDSKGKISRGVVWQVEKTFGQLQGQLIWQNLEPGFWSPLAKTNKYTADRRGWDFAATYSCDLGQIGFNLRRQSNWAQTKNYKKHTWSFVAPNKKSSIEWRIEPTMAIIVRHNWSSGGLQLDLWNRVFRCDWKRSLCSFDLRCDLERQIFRFELQADLGMEWRIVTKHDFLLNRTNYYVRGCYGTKDKQIQIEIGHYDQGNLLAGFNHSSELRISWIWEF